MYDQRRAIQQINGPFLPSFVLLYSACLYCANISPDTGICSPILLILPDGNKKWYWFLISAFSVYAIDAILEHLLYATFSICTQIYRVLIFLLPLTPFRWYVTPVGLGSWKYVLVHVHYSPFQKTLPRSSLQIHQISVKFHTMGYSSGYYMYVWEHRRIHWSSLSSYQDNKLLRTVTQLTYLPD